LKQFESEEVLLMILDSGQTYRSLGEWRRLCHDSQVRAHEARLAAEQRRERRRGRWMVLFATITMAVGAVASYVAVNALS
jgi:hypothetical protein